MAKRTAYRPRQQDKRGEPSAPRPRPYGTLLRRYRPPSAHYGLWEMPDGFGITVLR